MITPPPTDSELVEIWSEAIADVVALGASLSDEQWHLPTPCPGWSVGDVVAHLVDVEGVLAEVPRPDHEPVWDDLPHIQNDFGRWTEVGVDRRRGWPRMQVLEELEEVAALRRQQLAEVPEGAQVIGPLGNPTSLDRLLRIRVLDIWMHEQDIRTAVSRDGGWDTRPAQISYEQIERALPIVWSRTCQAPVGSVVQVTVNGPGLRGQMAAVVGEDGKGALVEPVGEADVLLTLTWPDLVSLSAGRVDPTDPDLLDRLTLSGDDALSTTLLRGLSITP